MGTYRGLRTQALKGGWDLVAIAGEVNRKPVSAYSMDLNYVTRSRGRPEIAFVDQLIDGTRIRKEELVIAVDGSNGWKEVIRNVCLRTTI